MLAPLACAALQTERIMVPLREEDRKFAVCLGRWLHGAFDLLGNHLQGLSPGVGSDDEGFEGSLPAGGRHLLCRSIHFTGDLDGFLH